MGADKTRIGVKRAAADDDNRDAIIPLRAKVACDRAPKCQADEVVAALTLNVVGPRDNSTVRHRNRAHQRRSRGSNKFAQYYRRIGIAAAKCSFSSFCDSRSALISKATRPKLLVSREREVVGKELSMPKEKCFIIAPSTPPERAALYGDDTEHCRHVLDCLLIPAVEEAGFEAIPPVAHGADLIHAGIVEKIQDCPHVLCDMSGLNANVFFELGLRTAMNKPVCLIRNDKTPKAPFDLGVINHHEYLSDLATWVTKSEIPKIAAHLKISAAVADNALWKYFGLRIAAEAQRSEPNAESGMELLRMEVSAMRKLMESLLQQSPEQSVRTAFKLPAANLANLAAKIKISEAAHKSKVTIGHLALNWDEETGRIVVPLTPPPEAFSAFKEAVSRILPEWEITYSIK